jgi:predicted peroxiredoxin
MISAKRIQLPIGSDDVGAAAVNAVLIPAPRIHERLDEQAEGVRFIQLELPEQRAERFAFATALRQVFEAVTDFVAEKALHFAKVDEVADQARTAVAGFQQIANRRAIRIAARQGCEVFVAEAAMRLFHRGEDDVGRVEISGVLRVES